MQSRYCRVWCLVGLASYLGKVVTRAFGELLYFTDLDIVRNRSSRMDGWMDQ